VFENAGVHGSKNAVAVPLGEAGRDDFNPQRNDPDRLVARLARNMDLEPFIGQAACAKILSGVIRRQAPRALRNNSGGVIAESAPSSSIG
jgi:hypothetical protein